VWALVWAAALSAAPAQRRDYFTGLEIADIQAAQEIDYRTEVLLTIAERRLAALGLLESEAGDPQGEPGLGGKVGRTLIRIFNPEAARELEAAEKERAALEHDLSDHTRPDLLRGYNQALEETMDNIDDAYERGRGNVEGPIRALRDFAGAALALLEDMDPQSEGEETALREAVEQSQVAFEGAGEALETIGR
jgi:hypothetical protein